MVTGARDGERPHITAENKAKDEGALGGRGPYRRHRGGLAVKAVRDSLYI